MPEPAVDGVHEVRTVAAGPGALFLYIRGAPSAEISRHLGAWRRALERERPPALRRAIHDVIPGYVSLLIVYQPTLAIERVTAWALSAQPTADEVPAGSTHEIAVAYGADADRTELEKQLEMPFEEIAGRHAAAEYTVAFLGFTPGFPYLLGLPDVLRAPRRNRPRERTPAGAVAIAGGQAGIYPSESPGGWWVLGRTDATLFDPGREPPALLAPGDAVRFRAVESALADEPRSSPPDDAHATSDHVPDGGTPITPNASASPTIQVTDAWPRSVSLQGPPRRSVGHLGMAEAGALDPRAYAEANAILGNAADAIAIEAVAQPVGLLAMDDLRAAITGGGLSVHLDGQPLKRWRAFDWPAGTSLELVPDRQVPGATTYLAVAGGFHAHVFADSGSTDARAGVGGAKRFLARDDTLALHAPTAVRLERPRPGTPRYPERIVLRIHPGPQFDADAWKGLLLGSFRVAVLDRTGARLEGPSISLQDHEITSEGSPAGAIQVPPDGQPVVLLADRGRTGGYAKPAIVDPRDLWQLAQTGAQTEVWFEPASANAGARPVH